MVGSIRSTDSVGQAAHSREAKNSVAPVGFKPIGYEVDLRIIKILIQKLEDNQHCNQVINKYFGNGEKADLYLYGSAITIKYNEIDKKLKELSDIDLLMISKQADRRQENFLKPLQDCRVDGVKVDLNIWVHGPANYDYLGVGRTLRGSILIKVCRNERGKLCYQYACSAQEEDKIPKEWQGDIFNISVRDKDKDRALIQRFNQEIKKGNLENLMSLTFPDAGPPIFEEIKNKIMELLNSEIQLTEDDKSRLEISKDLDEIANDVVRRSELKNKFVEKINKVIIEKLRAENSVLKNEIRSKEEGEKKEKRDLQCKIQRLQQNAQRLQQNAQAKLERRTGDFKKKLATKQKGFKTTLEKNREDFKKNLEEKEEAYNKLSMERDGWYAEQLASIEKIQLQNEELQDLRKQNQKIDILEKKIAKLDSWYSKETSKLKKEVDVLKRDLAEMKNSSSKKEEDLLAEIKRATKRRNDMNKELAEKNREIRRLQEEIRVKDNINKEDLKSGMSYRSYMFNSVREIAKQIITLDQKEYQLGMRRFFPAIDELAGLVKYSAEKMKEMIISVTTISEDRKKRWLKFQASKLGQLHNRGMFGQFKVSSQKRVDLVSLHDRYIDISGPIRNITAYYKKMTGFYVARYNQAVAKKKMSSEEVYQLMDDNRELAENVYLTIEDVKRMKLNKQKGGIMCDLLYVYGELRNAEKSWKKRWVRDLHDKLKNEVGVPKSSGDINDYLEALDSCKHNQITSEDRYKLKSRTDLARWYKEKYL